MCAYILSYSEQDALELYFACYSSDYPKIITKLQHGVDPNHQLYNGYGSTPLWETCRNDNPDALQSLIEWGVDIETVDSRNSHTPLHYSCVNGSIAAVKKLLKYNSNTGESSQCQCAVV